MSEQSAPQVEVLEPDQVLPEPMALFIETLQLTNDAEGLGRRLDDAMRRVNEAVNVHGKEGKLTLTIKVKRAKSDYFEVSHDVTVKLPKAEPESTFLFMKDDHRLSRRNPRQYVLPTDKG